MKRALSELIFADCLFIIFLSLSGVFDGAVGNVFYILTFTLPLTLILFLGKSEEAEPCKISLLASKKSLITTSLFIFPTVFLMILFAFLTSLLMKSSGSFVEAETLEGNLFLLILTRAFSPAVFEEMLFRYVPIKLLKNHSPRLTVIYSSILFSFAHCNLFQIPYAFVAGLIFALLDVSAGSILPSVVIHFANNVFSVIWQRNGENSRFVLIFLLLISFLALASAVIIYLRRKRLKKEFSEVFEDKSKLIFTYPLIMYMAVTLFAAVSAF